MAEFYLVLHPIHATTEEQARTQAEAIWSQLVSAGMRLWAERMAIDRTKAGLPLDHGPRHPRLMCEPNGALGLTRELHEAHP